MSFLQIYKDRRNETEKGRTGFFFVIPQLWNTVFSKERTPDHLSVYTVDISFSLEWIKKKHNKKSYNMFR